MKLWQRFSDWVTNGWSDFAFYAVVIVSIVLALLCIMDFVKNSYSAKKDKKLKWGKIVLFAVFAAIATIVCVARFTVM